MYIAFRNNDNNLRDIWLTRSTDGGDSFSSAFDVDETDWIVSACPSNGPHFAIVDDEDADHFLLTDLPSSQTYPSMIFSGTSFHVVY